MSGTDKLLVDTNLFIYLFEGNKNAAQALVKKEIHFSFVTQIELIGNVNITTKQEHFIREFLSQHNKLGYTNAIENTTILLKKKYSLKVPDAIIAATAILNDIPLLTADKAFGKISDLRCILFEV